MLNELRNLDIDRLDLTEAIALHEFGTNLRAAHESHSCEIPEWLDNRISELGHEIRARRRDQLTARLYRKQQELATLRTRSERRKDLGTEIAELEKALA